ncbi:MAG: UPF0104 family protein [Wenzhouxiangella sp.]|nr:MAG: UPF0104 family protein [Wenzhouxiangella sp.]
MSPRRRALLNWLVSAVVLLALAAWLDWREILRGLIVLNPGWLALALILALGQTVLAAWRWRYTCARLGLTLSPRQAIEEYFLSSLANQVLPGGVLGDAWRAQRHADASQKVGPAWRSVILERASGQLAVVLITLSVLIFSPTWQAALERLGIALPVLLVAALVLSGLIALAIVLLARNRTLGTALAITWQDARRALLNARDLPFQLLSSLAIVATLAAVFASAGQAASVAAGFGVLWLLAVPVLLAMLIPLSVAGWGFREAAAAGIFMAVGLSPEQGVTVAAAYGLIVLAASLPGALILIRTRRPS